MRSAFLHLTSIRILSFCFLLFSGFLILFMSVSEAQAATTCEECADDYRSNITICENDATGPDLKDCIDGAVMVLTDCRETYCTYTPPPLDESTTDTPSTSTSDPDAPAPNKPVASPAFDTLLRDGLLRANVGEPCKARGDCSISDILQVVINVMTFLLGITGSLFLLMFVWGGVIWLTSAGDSGRYQKGLDTFRDAIIGLLLVFGAYLIVNTVLSIARTGNVPTGDLGNTLNTITNTKTIDIK